MLSTETFEKFFSLGLAGSGLLLIAFCNLVLSRSRMAYRVVATLLIGGAMLGVAWAMNQNVILMARIAGLLAAGALLGFVLGSEWVSRLGMTLGRWIRHPAFRWGGLAVVGAATTIASAAVYQAEDEAATEECMIEMGFMTYRPPAAPAPIQAVTDRGRAIVLFNPTDPRDPRVIDDIEGRMLQKSDLRTQVIRHQSGNDQSNCHGWVFTGGQYQLDGNTVADILNENGYEAVTTPRPGDLIVYRVDQQTILHTALVRYVTEGQSVMVEGKWGCGGVYLHPAEHSIYGPEYTFYRSPRPGHMLIFQNGSGQPVTPSHTDTLATE